MAYQFLAPHGSANLLTIGKTGHEIACRKVLFNFRAIIELIIAWAAGPMF